MKRIPTFLAGMLTAAVIGGLGVGALAAASQFTITVDPINIQVNGATFQPKDANGNDVPVFAYNGTTYAPLRALAEAYGLEVGYDAEAKMATVGEKGSVATPATPAPDATPSTDYSDWSEEEEAAYQEFKGMWNVETFAVGNDEDDGHPYTIYNAVYKDTCTRTELKEYLNANKSNGFIERFVSEHAIPSTEVILSFGCIDSNGERWGMGGYTIYD